MDYFFFKVEKNDQGLIHVQYVFLQIGSSFVLDQVPGIFLFWVLLDLADEIVVTFTTLEIRTVEGNAVLECIRLCRGVALGRGA